MQEENKVRIDTGVREGDTITTFYDPMISKLIVAAPDRNQAIQALYNALNDYKVIGLKTNIKFLKTIQIVTKYVLILSLTCNGFKRICFVYFQML